MSETSSIEVDSAAALRAALSNSTGGETVLLAPGDYGSLGVYSDTFGLTEGAAGVTVRSADPGAQAIFSGLDMRGVAGLAFEDITFDHVAEPHDPAHLRLASVTSSEDITFRNVTFVGDPSLSDDSDLSGTPAGFGLQIGASSGVTIANSEFVGLRKGLRLIDSQDIVVRGTEIHAFREDGMNLVNVQNVLIENNHIHSAQAAHDSDDHRDMIQMWSTATSPDDVSRDVTFRGNLLDIGDGDYTQGLFISNRPVTNHGKGTDFHFSNIVIEGNVIRNDQPNYLRVAPTDGLEISNNTLERVVNPEHPNRFDVDPRIVLDGVSSNVTLTDNVIHKIVGLQDRDDWTVAGNGPDADGAPASDAATQPAPEPAPAPADPDRKIVGGGGGDTMTGGSGDDEFVLRFGNDTATGGAGADAFIIDWRYRDAGDAHTLTDLDFEDGDEIAVRFFDGRPITVDSAAGLEGFVARADVTAETVGDALHLTLDDGTGGTLGLTLNGLADGAPSEPTAPEQPTEPEEPTEPEQPTEPDAPADPDRKIVGGGGDDTMTGGSGDDEFVLRFGNDTATGGAGADAFIIDWRYRDAGDAHTLTDLDFEDGDEIAVRFFDGRPITVDSAAGLEGFVARADVTAETVGDALHLTLDDGTGGTLGLTLNGFDEFQFV